MPRQLRKIDWEDVRMKRESFFQQMWTLSGMMMGAMASMIFGLWGFVVVTSGQLLVAILFGWIYLRAVDPLEKE